MIHNKPLEEMSSSDRKRHPIARGVLDYFPDAIAAVANVSLIGNEQHNPGEPMHWAREKSQDHADCIARHLLARGTLDDDGVLHSAKTAWRALAQLQLEIEQYRELEAVKDAQPSTASPHSQDSRVGSISDTVVVVKGSSRTLLKLVQDSVNECVDNEYAWRSLTRRNWTVIAFRTPRKGDCYAAIEDGHLTGTVVKSNRTLNPYISRFILAGGSLA